MFHHFEAQTFEPQRVGTSTEPRWYVSDEDYQEAIRRGEQLRSEVAVELFRALRLRSLI